MTKCIKVSKENLFGWSFYYDEKRVKEFSKSNLGKWMYFFDSSEKGISFAENICEKAVRLNVVIEAKHTEKDVVKNVGTSVCCFYCDGDNLDDHKRVISFFLENNMIKKTKSKRFTNISFKFNTETRNGDYGSNFNPKIKLSDFINLETGEWL